MKHHLSSFKHFGIMTSMFLSALLSTQVFAEDYMSEEAVKALVVGYTFHATHMIEDFDFKVYFDPDGKTALRQQGGETTKTTYEFNGNQHCILEKGNKLCANIQDNGDSTYTRVNTKGKKVVKWTKVAKGKDL